MTTIAIMSLASAALIFIMLRGHLAWPIFLVGGLAALYQAELLTATALEIVATSTIVALLGASALHVYWALGGTWMLDRAVPDLGEESTFAPGPLLTLVVAGAQAAFAGNSPKKQYEDELRVLAESLGLNFVRPTRHEGPRFRGRIGTTKVRVRTARTGTCRIKAKFESGLTPLSGSSVQPQSASIRTNKTTVITEDHTFDSAFRTLADPSMIEVSAILNYLTPQRREVIQALGEAFERVRIEDDELEIHIAQDPPIDALRNAIDLCVVAASAFDRR